MPNIEERLRALNWQITAMERALEELLARRQGILAERDGRLQEAAQAADPTDQTDGFDRILRGVSPAEAATMHGLHSGKGVETDP